MAVHQGHLLVKDFFFIGLYCISGTVDFFPSVTLHLMGEGRNIGREKENWLCVVCNRQSALPSSLVGCQKHMQ